MPSQYWKSGSTRSWRKTRLQVLKRDLWRCQLRLPGTCKTRADCVHHTRGKQHGDDPAYLVAACTPCNLAVGDPRAHDPAPRPASIWE